MPTPNPSAVDAVHQGAVPAVAVFEMADPPLRAGAPLHQPPEASGVLVGLAGGAGCALSRDRDLGDAQLAEVGVDPGLAIAAVGGRRLRRPPGRASAPAAER
jgi:hypothetical protein